MIMEMISFLKMEDLDLNYNMKKFQKELKKKIRKKRKKQKKLKKM